MRAAHTNHTLLHVVRFLTGLNDNFAVVKSQILLMDPLPPLNKVFSMVLQHERQGGFAPTDDSSISINASRFKGQNSKSSSNRVCTFCGRDNHTIDTCFKKHGLPPHLRGKASANAAIEGDTDDTIADQAVTTGSSTITQDQAMQLITLLQNSFPNPSSGATTSNQVGSASFIGHSPMNKGMCHSNLKTCSLDTWILDSGASHHICNSVQWFHSYNAITPVPIRLPNGDHVFACFSGSIHFSPSFIITEVFCVPNFSINLMSVSKLVQKSNYSVAFHASYCTT
jgi:hypothetical protein